MGYFYEMEDVVVSPMGEYRVLKEMLFGEDASLTSTPSSTENVPTVEEDKENLDPSGQKDEKNSKNDPEPEITILHINPKTFARVLTQRLSDIWHDVDLSKVIQKYHNSTQLQEIRPFFDKTSRWIISELYSFPNHEERDTAFQQLILIMYELYKLNNYESLLPCCLSIFDLQFWYFWVDLAAKHEQKLTNKYQEQFCSWIQLYNLVPNSKKSGSKGSATQLQNDLEKMYFHKKKKDDMTTGLVIGTGSNNGKNSNEVSLTYNPIILNKPFIPCTSILDSSLEKIDNANPIIKCWRYYCTLVPVISACENSFIASRNIIENAKNEKLLLEKIIKTESMPSKGERVALRTRWGDVNPNKKRNLNEPKRFPDLWKENKKREKMLRNLQNSSQNSLKSISQGPIIKPRETLTSSSSSTLTLPGSSLPKLPNRKIVTTARPLPGPPNSPLPSLPSRSSSLQQPSGELPKRPPIPARLNSSSTAPVVPKRMTSSSGPPSAVGGGAPPPPIPTRGHSSVQPPPRNLSCPIQPPAPPRSKIIYGRSSRTSIKGSVPPLPVRISKSSLELSEQRPPLPSRPKQELVDEDRENDESMETLTASTDSEYRMFGQWYDPDI